MAQAPIRIVIVDDHALLAESLGAWIIRQPDLVLAGRAEDGETGYNLCLALKPDLALLDIDLPKVDGLELIRRFVVEMPAMRLLTMSGRMDPYTIWRVSQSGGHGYVEKTANPEILAKAIYAIAAGGTYFSELFQQIKSEWLGQPEAFQKILSDREQEVLRRVVTGDSDEQIAGQLGISVATIGVHRKHIRQKLELHNDRELVAYARKWGLDRD